MNSDRVFLVECRAALCLWHLVFAVNLLAAAELPGPPGFNPVSVRDSPEVRKYSNLIRGLMVEQAKYDPEWFRTNIQETKMAPELRESLLDPLLFYYQRTMNQQEVYDLIVSWHKELRSKLPLRIEKPWVKGAPLLPGVNLVTALPPVPIAKNELQLGAFEKLDIPRDDAREFFGVRLIDAKVVDNVLWLDARGSVSQQGESPIPCGLLFGVNLKTQQQHSIVYSPAFSGAGCFEVSGQSVLLRQADGLKRYDLPTRQLSDLPHILESDARLVSCATNLYAVSSNSVVNVDLKNGTTAVLASLRRRPAETLVDGLPTLAPSLFLPLPNGSLTLLAGREVYHFGPDKQWIKAYSLTTNGFIMSAKVDSGLNGSFAGFALVEQTFEPSRLFGLLPGAKEPLLLAGDGRSQWEMRPGDTRLAPQWVYAGFGMNGYQTWRGKDFLSTTISVENKEAVFQLVYFQAQPRRVVLLQCMNAVGAKNNRSFGDNVKLLPLADGWAAVPVGGEGYWFFTTADLDKALAGAK